MLAPMFDPAFRHHLSPRTCLLTVRERCRAAHPGGLSCQIVGFEPFASPSEGSGAPKFAGAERRTRWPVLRSGLSRQRTGLPVHRTERGETGERQSRGVDMRQAAWLL